MKGPARLCISRVFVVCTVKSIRGIGFPILVVEFSSCQSLRVLAAILIPENVIINNTATFVKEIIKKLRQRRPCKLEELTSAAELKYSQIELISNAASSLRWPLLATHRNISRPQCTRKKYTVIIISKTTDSNIKMLPDISFVRLLFDAMRDKRFSSYVVYHRDKLNTFFYPSSFSTKTGVSQLLLSFVKSND